MRTFCEVSAAALAVIGFYALLRAIGEIFLTSRPITAAVKVFSSEQLDALELLLGEADRHSIRTRGHRVVVLFSHGLFAESGAGGAALPGSVAELLDRFNADWYVVDPSGVPEAGDADCGTGRTDEKEE